MDRRIAEERYIRVFGVYREYVKHQYELLNHRTNWYILVQSLLFASCAMLAQASAAILEKAVERHESAQTLLSYIQATSLVLSCVGIYTSVIAWLGINAAGNPIGQLQNQWRRVLAEDPELQGAKNAMPHMLVGGDSDGNRARGVRFAKFVPVGLGLAWVLVLGWGLKGHFSQYFSILMK